MLPTAPLPPTASPSALQVIADALASAPRLKIFPALGARFIGTPLARGKASLGDHAIGVITRLPTPFEVTYEFRVLWRDPLSCKPVQVRHGTRIMAFYANRFHLLGANEPPPLPYSDDDFALLAKEDRLSYERAGFELHGYKDPDAEGGGGRMRGRRR